MISRWKTMKAEPEEVSEECKQACKEGTVVSESEQKRDMMHDNRGVGVVEVILILVVIFTIYMGCK